MRVRKCIKKRTTGGGVTYRVGALPSCVIV